MTDCVKVYKLIHRLQHLAARLEAMRDLVTHQHISQFYYMQKVTELKLMCDQLEEAKNRMANVSSRLKCNYEDAFNQWRMDLRWLENKR